MDTNNLIIEGAIFQEAEIVKTQPSRAIFRMTMQDADMVNQNKRLYPKKVLTDAMKNCEDRIKRRAFLGEVDHPVPTGQSAFDSVRQVTVSLERASHLVRSYEWKGNRLVGELETTTTEYGKNLFALLKDKCGIGLSMRGMAELDRQTNYNVVKAPLFIITFDAVSLPSHKSAVVDFNEMRFESLSILTESRSGVICTPDGRCYLPNYFDKLVETKVIRFFDKWV